MEKYNKRSSILKKPMVEESSPTFTRSTRRISFSGKKNVKEFMPGDGGATIWITSYEESAEVVPGNSTKGKLYGGPQATPELIMRLRNNKIISKIPQSVNSKAKKSKGVENESSVTKCYEEEEQFSRKFCESLDISLSVSEIQKLKISKTEERLPLRPITQHLKQIEATESYVSPQTSLTCPSPEKIYCSFALTKNEIRKLSKLNNGKQLDFTLVDILTDSDKRALYANHQSNNVDVNLAASEMVQEANVSSAYAMRNISKPKRETMFNLENMDLVSIQKSPSKRATIYYYDSLELSLKSNEKQRVSFSKLKKLDTPYELQEENLSLVEDCDKENRVIGVESSDMELSFASIVDSMKLDPQKSVEMKATPVDELYNDDMNKENCGYIESDSIIRNRNAVQNINRLGKELSVHDCTTQEERDLGKMDISLSPGSFAHSMHVKPSRNQETIRQSCGISEINAKKENKPINFIKRDKIVLIEDQENKTMDISVTDGTEDSFNDGMIRAPRRQTVNIPWNLDLTLQDDKLHVNEESLGNSNRKLSFNKTEFLDASHHSISTKSGLNIEVKNYNIQSEDLPTKNIKCSENRRTILNNCDLDLTLQDENQSITAFNKSEVLKSNLTSIKTLGKRCSLYSCDLDLTLENESQLPNASRSKVDIKSTDKRRTVNNVCDLDLTLKNSEQSIDDKLVDKKLEEIYQKSSDETPKFLEKRCTVYNTCDLDLTLENVAQLTYNKIIDTKSEEYLSTRDLDLTLDNTAQLVVDNLFDKKSRENNQRPEENVKFLEKRRTVYNTCDLELTLSDNLQLSNNEIGAYNQREQMLDNRPELEMATNTNILPRSPFTWGKKRMPLWEANVLKDASRQSTEEIFRDKRRTIHAHCDLDITLQNDVPQLGNKTELKTIVCESTDAKNQCMNLSIESSQILKVENKVNGYEKIDSRIQRQTLHNHLDLDYTLEEEIQGRCTKQGNSKVREFEISINTENDLEHELRQKTSQDGEANFDVKRHTIEHGAPQKTSQSEEENCRTKRRSVYTPLDMDLEEETKSTFVQPTDLKEYAGSCLKLKEQNMVKNSSNNEQNMCSINFTHQGRNDLEFMKWSPTPAPANLVDECFSKKNVIFSAKRQTIYEQCDLDISMHDETIEVAEFDDRLPENLKSGTDTNAKNIKCSSKINAENNTNSSVKRKMSSPVNLDLTIQNNLKDSKREINNEQTLEPIATITSVKDNKQHNIETFKRAETLSCLPINTQKTVKQGEYNAKEPITPTSYKSQSSQNKTLNMLHKSPGKNSSNSVQIWDFTMEEGAKGNELVNMPGLKSTESNMERNSLKNIDLSGCEQLDQTSEVIFCDLSSSNGTIDFGIEQLRTAESVTETSEIPRFSRGSSSHTNTINSTLSANTTQALCNMDLNKITKKYKSNLKSSGFINPSHIVKSKDTSFDNSYEYITPVSKADDIQKANLSVSNFNLNCTSKDVNLKNDNCENKLKGQQTIESKTKTDRQQSFCSKCKACDCKPALGENKGDISTFCWKFETPSQPCKVDFSGYEKFQHLPSIRDILDAHKRRRESLNFESYEESVFCPIVPSMDFLLENYEKQYKLQVEKELSIGAIFPLIPSLEILLSNKLQTESFGWKLNTLCMPVGIMEFRHTIIPSITLILKYSPNSFYSNEDKVIFEKVQLKISNMYGISSPFDRIIENEITVKAPYDLINYCSCFNDLFSFLGFMNSICEKAIQLGNELFVKVVSFNGSLEKDNNDECFIKKTVRYNPDCSQKVLMSTQNFLVRVRNIEKISYTDIMLPPLSDFKDSICLMPQGLEFLKRFFLDPISYLKTKS